MTIEAAKTLVRLKTQAGKTVPEFAKRIVSGEDTNEKHLERAAKELFIYLSQMRNSLRAKIMHESPEVKKWYDDYRIANADSVAVAVSKAADGIEANAWYQGMAR